MRRTVSLYGLATLQAYRKSPLNLVSQHHRLLPRNSPPLRMHLSLLHLLLTRKDGSSLSCSATSWTPPNSPPNSIRKIIGTWYVHTKKSAQKLSHALKDTWHSS